MNTANRWILIAALALCVAGVGSAMVYHRILIKEHREALTRVAATNARPDAAGWDFSAGLMPELSTQAAQRSAPGFTTFDVRVFCQDISPGSELGLACKEVLASVPQR